MSPDRRDFLKTALGASVAALPLAAACGQPSSAPSPAAPPDQPGPAATGMAAGAVTANKEVLFTFYGLCTLVSYPNDVAMDVALPPTSGASGAPPHYPTLSVPRTAVVSADSTWAPVAADLDRAIYDISNATIRVAGGGAPFTANRAAATPAPGADPLACPSAKDWNSLAWVLKMSEMVAGATLRADYPAGLAARVLLRTGAVEPATLDDPVEGQRPISFYRCPLPGGGTKDRLLKEAVRWLVSAPKVMITRTGASGAVATLVLDADQFARLAGGSQVRVDVLHIPVPGTPRNPPAGLPMKDIAATYALLGGAHPTRPVPEFRGRCMTAQALSGCDCCIATEVATASAADA